MRKVICKRTYRQSYSFTFSVNGNTHADWIKGNFYNARDPLDHQLEYIYIFIMDDYSKVFIPISKKVFDKCFTDISDYRESMINKIISD